MHRLCAAWLAGPPAHSLHESREQPIASATDFDLNRLGQAPHQRQLTHVCSAPHPLVHSPVHHGMDMIIDMEVAGNDLQAPE